MLAFVTFSSDQSSLDLSFASGKNDSDAFYGCAWALSYLTELNATLFACSRANCTLASRDALLQLSSLPELNKLTLRAFPVSDSSLFGLSLVTVLAHRASTVSQSDLVFLASRQSRHAPRAFKEGGEGQGGP